MLPIRGSLRFDAGRRRVIESQTYHAAFVPSRNIHRAGAAVNPGRVCTASATSPASTDTGHAHAGSCARRVRRARRGQWDWLHRAADNHAPGYNGGPYNDLHQFPRLKFAEGDYCADSRRGVFRFVLAGTA